MFQYVLFDLDGTLTDPREGITKSVQFALAQQGISEPDLKKLEPFIGPPLKDSFMEFYGMTEEQAAQVWQITGNGSLRSGNLKMKFIRGYRKCLAV